MGVAKQVLYFMFHPNQLRSVIQWKVWHEPVHKRDPSKETPTEKACYHYLDLTSRSFSAVIQELNPELLMPITIFYLVLRGLDTIEDDMTIDIKTKEPLLRNFHEVLEKDGWTFNGNGPNEKDRELLVHFDNVIAEFKKTKKEYAEIIRDIAIKMENGMADYAVAAEKDSNGGGVETVADYELYCHYVAGLVGEGLTRLFVEGKLANPALLERMELTESMGQFLQKTNIIRDVHEDHLDGRSFWPKEIWGKYVDNYADLFKKENREKALHCSSELVLNALKHADECLFYMAGIRDQSVFNFVAIPQSMAIATLELVFRNPDIFEKHIKITKGDACQLMLESTQNLRVVCDAFRRYARRIHQKNDPRDPNFMAISIQCAKIEQFIEGIFPTQNIKEITAAQELKKKEEGPGMDTSETLFLILAVLIVLFVVGGLMIGLAWFMGARFDKVFESISEAKWFPTDSAGTAAPAPIAHEEL
ncbi:Farnesyl-diphosphate farnesyl transferase [Pleurostoma richardsiae]|uniref:Squalene synthase n=1 Tax=Pleurostoma richardsiae TaxID=41990 RepID=A0AA38VWB0_9PEZI|nr:Farnesyl-diphosphate farnesyl transferase [Pleurostoma richardsiae]